MNGEDKKTKCSKCGKMVDVVVSPTIPRMAVGNMEPTKKVCLECFDKECKAVGNMARQVQRKLR